MSPLTFSRSLRSRLLVFVVSIAVLTGAGYFGMRAWEHGADRRAALALAESGPPDRALPALLACLNRDPNDPELLKAVVEAQIKTGAPVTEVEPLTERWCRASPDDPAAFVARADALRRLARFPEAVEAAERAGTLVPDDVRGRTVLAGLYLAAGRFADAAREFRALLATQPTNTDYALALARAEWELGNQTEAVRITDEVLARAPASPGALLMRGLIHFRAGEFDRALAAFDRVPVTQGPERAMLLHHRAQALDRLGRPDAAQKVYAELTAVENADRFTNDAEQRPEDVGLQVRAAEALLTANQPDRARRLLEATRTRLGPNRAALNLLATCYDTIGRPDLAAQARTAAATAP